MFYYYFGLAVRSLKRNLVLTVLMIAAIGVGIGASMTTLTMFRAMDRDPIPQKSRQLFAVQIDNWGPKSKGIDFGDKEHLQGQISYIDAIGLMNAHAAQRQSAMYVTGAALTPSNPDLRPFQVAIRAAYTDFFKMFDTPFLMGGPWTAADDAAHADVVVLSQQLNDKIFGGANSIGKTINLDNHEYRVVGVMNRWEPIPKFYDLNNDAYGKSEDLFLPFTRAIDGRMESWGNNNCAGETMASGMGRPPAFRVHLDTVLGGIAHRGGCRALPRRRQQLCGGSAAHRPFQLAAPHADTRCTRVAGARARRLRRSANSGAGVVQLSTRLPAQRHGLDVGEDHGASRRYRRAARARRQSPRNFRAMPDRGRRDRLGGWLARSGAHGAGSYGAACAVVGASDSPDAF